jgi:hypothetical protein
MVEEEDAVAFTFLVVMAIFTAIGIPSTYFWVTGQFHPLSEPIKNLEPGQLYEVLGIARDGENCYLLLRAKSDNVIRYYRLPSNQVPPDLQVGDGLIQIPTGLQRLPQYFAQP